MAKRTLQIILDVEVSDLPDTFRADLAKDAGMKVAELPTLAETSDSSIAYLFEAISGSGFNTMFFEGTDLFVEFTNCKVLGYKWTN